MGRTNASGCLDTGGGSTHHHDVRHGSDADAVPQAASGEISAADHCCVVNVSPLLKELILHACTLASLKKTVQVQQHLIDVIIDQLEAIQMVPLQLPAPSDPRAIRVAKLLSADPSDRRTLAGICKVAGASKRTVERLFQEDVGMTFGKWRQQLRLMQAMRLLAEGAKVTHAALESGYSTSSAFISMFRKTLGTTPTLYFRTETIIHEVNARRKRTNFRYSLHPWSGGRGKGVEHTPWRYPRRAFARGYATNSLSASAEETSSKNRETL
jgi:AraC-like DNA-binding protein